MTPTDAPKADKPRRRWLRWGLLGAIGILAVMYVAGFLLTGTRMPANATIAGVEVGGMSPAAAEEALERATTPKLDEPIVIADGATSLEVNPREIGLALDLKASVDRAGGQRSWNPKAMIGLFFGSHDFSPVIRVDQAKIDGTLDSLSEQLDKEVVEAQITFKDTKPVARQPKAGLVVSREDTVEAIKDAYLVSDDPVEVVKVVVEPAVDQDGLERAMTEFAEPAVSGPVTLRVGDKDVPLPPSAYAPALIVAVKNGALTPSIDAKKLKKPLTDSTTGIGKKAVDATVRIESGKPVVVPSKVGIGLRPEELATTLIPVLSKTGAERVLEIKAKAVEPEITTKEVKKLGIVEKTGSFTTYYAPATYRDVNQSRAAALIDGTIIMPGETFSFNDTVGERTVANGFTSGTIIKGGVFREELGGGVSQVVTTTYNAAFFAALTDIEHHPHGLYISRYPVGREATVYWGSLDLRFRNDSKYGVLINASVQKSAGRSRGTTTVEMWSTKVYDIKAGLSARRNFRKPQVRYDPTDRCVPSSPSTGFDVDVYRYFYQGGKKVKTETDTAVYRATSDVRCRAKPKDDD